MGRPRHRVESQVSCPKPFRLATAAQSPGHRPSTCPEPVSEINVAQPTLPRVLRRSLHGTPAWLRQRLPPPTSNPSSRSTPSSAPAAIGCSPRPPAAPAATASPTAKLAPGPAPPRRHPGRLETRPPRPLPPPPGRHHHQPGRARHRLPQPPGGDRDTTPGGKLVFHIFAVLAEFERDLIRERIAAGLAAARARGRRGDRPSVLTVARIRWLS
jgi:Resolvase, N terminal domain